MRGVSSAHAPYRSGTSSTRSWSPDLGCTPTGALETFSPKNGGGAGYLVRPDRLLIYGVGEVNYTATGGVAEFMGTP